MISVMLTPNFLMVGDAEGKISEEKMAFILEQVEKIKKDGVEQGEIDELIQILQEKFGEESVYTNAMCRVLGIGGGILFPPFIPLSPLVITTPIVLLDTDGLNGHWFHGANIAIFIAFIGFPIYIAPPPVFIIVGFAGFVIGISFK
ncbi:MAG TPA: hypothetical protein ENI33_00045 [Thermoplasmatales archaeon]|nr:hypothetical protein [Thermoplasmatales archaeon]